jgi:ATP-binding cassette subfamily F protein 3
MTLVRLQDAGKQYGDRWIIRHVSFHVVKGDRWGIVGRNGVGKTTLLKMLTGEDEPTEGDVWRHPGLRFTHMRQNRGEQSASTIREAALEPFADLVAMEERLHREAHALAEVDHDSDEGRRLMASYDRHGEEFRRRGGYEMHARSEATLEGLGFPADTWEKPIRALSGGELGRLRLVQTLLAEPDVLLLDEPTNHLDLRSTEWLEEYLKSYPGTVMAVSHDRVFLERLCDHVLHLEEGTAFAYGGSFDSFLEQREARRELQRKQYEQQQAYIARTEDFIRRNLAGQKTKQAQSRRTLLSRLDRVSAVSEEGRAMALRFGQASRSGGTVLRLDGVTCAYGSRTLFAPFSAEVSREERIAVIGPNGCGKSTLMRAIAGETAPCGGSVIPGSGVVRAYYRQDFTHLDDAKTIWQEVSDGARGTMQELRGHLGRFLFSGDDIQARIGDLSGGEQARVALAKITLQRANLLLLDEPTNHLDLESREVLEEAIQNYDGTVILISHDRAFLSETATRVWSWTDGRFEDYPGGFDEWRDWVARRKTEPAAASPSISGKQAASASPPAPSAPKPAAKPASTLSKNEQRRREAEMERLEVRIQEAEARVAEVEAALADPALYAADADASRARALAEERDALTTELAYAYATWERLGEELAGV